MAWHKKPSPFCCCGHLFITVEWLRVCAHCDGRALIDQLRYRWAE